MVKRVLSLCICFALALTLTSCGKSEELPITAFPISDVANQVGQINFIDLGKAEATLIQAGSTTILVDAGSSNTYTTLKDYLEGKSISTIDCLIVTNPQENFCGGATQLVEDFKVRQVLVPKWPADLINKYECYVSFNTAVVKQSIPLKNTNYGFQANLGQIRFLSLGPQGDFYKDDNDYSQILRFSMGGVTYLHMSGASSAAEQELVSGNLVFQSDIVRTTSLAAKGTNSKEFIEAADPNIIVAPGTKKPRPDVVDLYESHETEIMNIRDHSTVTFATDGRSYGVTSVYYQSPKD